MLLLGVRRCGWKRLGRSPVHRRHLLFQEAPGWCPRQARAVSPVKAMEVGVGFVQTLGTPSPPPSFSSSPCSSGVEEGRGRTSGELSKPMLWRPAIEADPAPSRVFCIRGGDGRESAVLWLVLDANGSQAGEACSDNPSRLFGFSEMTDPLHRLH